MKKHSIMYSALLRNYKSEYSSLLKNRKLCRTIQVHDNEEQLERIIEEIHSVLSQSERNDILTAITAFQDMV